MLPSLPEGVLRLVWSFLFAGAAHKAEEESEQRVGETVGLFPVIAPVSKGFALALHSTLDIFVANFHGVI